MGAELQGHHHGILGKLESTGPLSSGRVVATVPLHEMHHGPPVSGHRRTCGKRLRKGYDLPLLDQARCAYDLLCADIVESAALVLADSAARRLFSHDRSHSLSRASSHWPPSASIRCASACPSRTSAARRTASRDRASCSSRLRCS